MSSKKGNPLRRRLSKGYLSKHKGSVMLLTNATISKDMSSKLSLSFSRCNRQQKSNQNNTEGI